MYCVPEWVSARPAFLPACASAAAPHALPAADGVVATSNAVNGKLERRQAEIEELNSVRVLLHKLQGVFDLPRKLRAAIERQAFEVAADAYADAAPLLKKYGHKVGSKQAGRQAGLQRAGRSWDACNRAGW